MLEVLREPEGQSEAYFGHDADLSIRLLGGFVIEDRREGAAEERPNIASEPSRALFAFLALRRNTPHTRAFLAGQFWPDVEESKARRRLSQALWRIRQAFGGDVDAPLSVTSSTVQFATASTCWVDVEEFEAAGAAIERRWRKDSRSVSVDELEAAANLYRGVFLEGHYDDWMGPVRDRLTHGYLVVLGRLIQAHRRAGDLHGALAWARRRVAVDSHREESHQEVIRLCVVLERPTDARRQFEICAKIFNEELGVAPLPETQALVADLSPFRSRANNQFSTSIVGRRRERAALLRSVEDCASGDGGVLFVEGDPGSGKTLLLEDLADSARSRGVSVVWAEHSERSSSRPYEGLAAAMSRGLQGLRGEHVVEAVQPLWIDAAASLIPALANEVSGSLPSGLKPDEERWRQHEGLVQILLAHGRISPTLLVVDDLHWADEGTLTVLAQACGRLREAGVVLCVAYRRHEAKQAPTVWESLCALEATDAHQRFTLGPMPRDEVVDLVSAVGGWQPTDAVGVDQLLAETGGNPFFIVETLRARSRLSTAGLVGDAAFPVALSVASLLSQRFRQLGDEARAVLGGLSVFGRPLRSSEVGALTGLDIHDVRVGLAEALEANVVVERGREYEIVHHQMRRTVYGILGEEERRHLHALAVDLWVHPDGLRPTTWTEIAHHAALSQRWEVMVDASRNAAAEAMRLHATGLAASHLERALVGIGHLATAPTEMVREAEIDVLLRLEELFDVLGETDRRRQVLERLEIIVGALSVRRTDLLELLACRRASLLASQAEFAAALNELEDWPGSSPLRTAEILVLKGTILLWSGDSEGAVAVLLHALDALVAQGEKTAAVRCVLGSALNELQDFAAAATHLQAALSEAELANDIRSQVEALGGLASVATDSGRSDSAELSYRHAIELSMAAGYRRAEGKNLVNIGTLFAVTGRGAQALELFTQAELVFVSISDERGLAFVRFNRADLRCWLLGDIESAGVDARQAIEFFRSIGDVRHEALGLDVLANIARMQKRPTACRRHLARAHRYAVESGDGFTEVQAARTLGHLELDQGRFKQALEAVQPALSRAKELGLVAQLPVLAAIEAKALIGLDRGEEAAELALRTSQSIDDHTDRSHLALFWCGRVLASAGREEAFSLFEQSWKVLDRNLDGLSQSDRDRALTAVNENLAIDGERRRMTPEVVAVQLPDISAPFGRPLRSDEYVSVNWTVEDPADFDVEGKGNRRRSQLTRLVIEAGDQGAAPRIDDIVAVMGVSRATVKRDLAALRDLGFDLVTRGSFG